MNLVERNRMARRTVSSEVSGKGWVSGGYRDQGAVGMKVRRGVVLCFVQTCNHK